MTSRNAGPIALLVLLSCYGQPRKMTAPRFDPPKNYFDSILVEQTSAAGIQYSDAYELALQKNSAGLTRILRATKHTDGVGSDQQGAILLALLQRWGDSAFASVLEPETSDVRASVRCSLDYTADLSWASEYPRTAALAPLNPTCRGS
jgi:hypothetical protein